MTIEFKTVHLGLESDDIETLQESVVDGAAAAVEVDAVSQEALRLFEYAEGLENLALALNHYTKPSGADLALAEIATEMINIGAGADISKLQGSFENYSTPEVSLEGVLDVLKATGSKIAATLKKLWLGFKRMLGSLNSWIKLEVVQLKELRKVLSNLSDTDAEIQLDELSDLLTSGKARSFADLVKANAAQCDQFVKASDNYLSFISRYASAAYSGWKTKGDFKTRLKETTANAVKTLEASKGMFQLTVDTDDRVSYAEPSFKRTIGFNFPETISRIEAVGDRDADYRQLADAVVGFSAKAAKMDSEYATPQAMALPKVSEVIAMVDKLISFSEEWYRVQKAKVRTFSEVMTAWIGAIEAFDGVTVSNIDVGKITRTMTQLFVRDYGKLNQIAYSTANLFDPFYTYSNNVLQTTRNVRKLLEKLSKKFNKK